MTGTPKEVIGDFLKGSGDGFFAGHDSHSVVARNGGDWRGGWQLQFQGVGF